jgi:phage shock protein A
MMAGWRREAKMATNSENGSDLRFVLVEIGKLTSSVERLISDVKSMGEKVDELRHQVTFVRGGLYVISGILAVGAYFLAALYR